MYLEDVAAEVDMNVVCTGDGDFVEVQGTGEAGVFSRDQLDALLDLGVAGCAELAAAAAEGRSACVTRPDELLLATANREEAGRAAADPGRRAGASGSTLVGLGDVPGVPGACPRPG